MSENLLFVMSLSGTVVFLLYVICYPIAKRVFPLRWRYLMLKMALVFYLIPFSLLKYNLLGFIYSTFPELEIVPDCNTTEIDISEKILYSHDETFLPFRVKIIFIVVAIIGLVSLIIISRQIIWYLKIKRTYLKDGITISGEWQDLMNDMKAKSGIKGRLNFIASDFCESPMTVGVFLPTIVIPIELYEIEPDDNCKFMIQHELNHIKNKDLLIRFIALFVMVVHWFNPICYILYNEITNISEMYCDYCTVEDYNREQQKEYSRLIINIATGKYDFGRREYYAGLVSGNAKIIERRVLEIKAIGRKKRLILSCIIGGMACLAGGITTMAYTSPTTFIKDNTSLYREDELSICAYDGSEEDFTSEYFYIDEDGNSCRVTEKNTDSKVICKHIWKDTTVSKHRKYSDKSCKTTYHESQLCIVCESLIIGDEFKSVEYKTCPH